MLTLQGLNDRQQEAATHFEGPLLILAGAGSGKTRVLTNRIAWLIDQKGVNPWNILAITFTNKAAGEMRERVDNMVGFGSESVWVSTFHSMCARILRQHIGLLGYEQHFAIYDTDDQKTLMKELLKRDDLKMIDPKRTSPQMLLGRISAAKNELIGPDKYIENATVWYEEQAVAKVYPVYQDALKKNNALDFDDLLTLTVELFEKNPDVLAYYQNRFRFIMVDEYQDTNTAQFRLVQLLAGSRANLCVVGDDDQSIYRFRGANIQNILNFEKHWPLAKVIRLEQNYRSTQMILDTANAVISNNRSRKPKHLWTENAAGEKTRFREFDTAYDEAGFVAKEIRRKTRTEGHSYGEFAILYRTNAQSRVLEEKLLLDNIPYQLVGGINFYARKEIKDLLCYLKTVDNGVDDLAVRRIINIPKRGIGAASISKVQYYADVNGLSFYEALTRARQIPGIGRSAAKMESFTALIAKLREAADRISVADLLRLILEETGYRMELEAEGTDEAKDRISNIDELIGKAADYDSSAGEPSLGAFLEEVALVAQIDDMDDGGSRVTLMTLHSAKGLEFPIVYMCGMEEEVFPSYMSMYSENPLEEIEEERRLCYVGITRAMKELTMTCAGSRMVRGQLQFHAPSRFIREIPAELLDEESAGFGFGTRSGISDDSPFEMFGGSSLAGGTGSSSFASGGRSAGKRQSAAAAKTKGKGAAVYDLSQFKIKHSESLDYQEGDRVTHIKFGVGIVQKIEDGEKDFQVTVDFERAGIKKMLASFAKLKKLEE